MVSRVYVEKKPGFDVEAQQLTSELKTLLELDRLENVRLLNRYDVEGISDELFAQTVPTVFSEPQSDNVTYQLPETDGAVFAVEFLPGQFDQRAESASECVQLLSQGERPLVRSAKVYILEGDLTPEEVAKVKAYVINPVEAREASLEDCLTLAMEFPEPPMVETLDDFLGLDEAGLAQFIADRGLAMDLADIQCCQRYFAEEGRNPTITEMKMIDTYWSDHCRHTTFGTVLDEVHIEDPRVQLAFDKYVGLRHELGRDEKPLCLMDMGTIGARWLKAQGILTGLDESEEINACTVKCKVDVDGEEQDWLYLFKNETHNHPTEIEPFGGAATCVGGAIRDPLSGRSYVYQAMRVTGAADPTVPVAETLPGKLPQRKLVTTAAAGYSSYGNQIGLATGQVHELYHPGYAAKRMEIGAVVGATPADHVRRETPAPGDVVVLLGGRTGRDGIGGATGSSKAHSLSSIETCGAEVQKGNAPVERKIQRLFRRGDACRMIKRCNDFGAGGVSVAVGELADGLSINLNAVPKKYEGLDGTELAISESQERMAVALAPEDVDAFIALAHEENLEATPIATVTAEPRVRMSWNGANIVDVSREFLASNGAPKHADVEMPAGRALSAHLGGRKPEGAHDRPALRHQRGLQQGPLRALRLHYWRRYGAHALWRQVPAHPGAGHGCQVPGRRRDHHLFRHGLGLQPLPVRSGSVRGRLHRRGGIGGQAGGQRFRTAQHVPHLPRVLREAAARPRALGQAGGGGAGSTHGPAGFGSGGHRRQRLHVRLVRAAGRAPYAGVFRNCGRAGVSRHLSGVQGGRAPHRPHRVPHRRRHLAPQDGHHRGTGRGGRAYRYWRCVGGFHCGLRRRGGDVIQDVCGQPHRRGIAAGHHGRCPVRPRLRLLCGGVGRRRPAAGKRRRGGLSRYRRNYRRVSAGSGRRSAGPGPIARSMGKRHRGCVPLPYRCRCLA